MPAAAAKRKGLPRKGKKKTPFSVSPEDSFIQNWAENVTKTARDYQPLSFLNAQIAKDYKAKEFHTFKLGGGGAKAREDYMQGFINASASAKERALLQGIYDQMDKKDWEEGAVNVHGEGVYSVKFKTRDFADPFSALRREAGSLIYQSVYYAAESQFFGHLLNTGKSLESQITDLKAQQKKVDQDLKEFKKRYNPLETRIKNEYQNLASNKHQLRQEKAAINAIRQQNIAAAAPGQPVLNAQQAQRLNDIDGELDKIRRREKTLRDRRRVIREERQLRENAGKRIGAEIVRLNPKMREWFAPRRSGQTLFNERYFDKRQNKWIEDRGSGRFWQGQDFLDDPFSYSMRNFIWKGNPLPGGKRLFSINDPITGKPIASGLRDRVLGKHDWVGGWDTRVRGAIPQTWRGGKFFEFVTRSPFDPKKWQALFDLLSGPSKVPQAGPAQPPAPQPTPGAQPTPGVQPPPGAVAPATPGGPVPGAPPVAPGIQPVPPAVPGVPTPGVAPVAPVPGAPPVPVAPVPPGAPIIPTPVAPPIGPAVPPVGPPAPAPLASFFQNIGAGFQTVFQDLGTTVQTFINTLGPVLQQAARILTQLLQKLLDVVFQALSRALPHLLGFGGGVVGGGTAMTGAAGAGVAAGGAATGVGALAAETAAETALEVAAAPETAGVSLAIPLAKMAALIVVGLILLIAAIFIFLLIFLIAPAFKDVGRGGAIGETSVSLSKEVHAETPTGGNKIPTLDSRSHTVYYIIKVTNNADKEATEVKVSDARFGRNFGPISLNAGETKEIGAFSQTFVADSDRIETNTVTGTAVVEGKQVQFTDVGVLIIGNPAEAPPCGWPTTGTITALFGESSRVEGRHSGVDIAVGGCCGAGQETFSTLTGILVSASWNDKYGGMIRIKSLDGQYTVDFVHMSREAVADWSGKSGQTIAIGTKLGKTHSGPLPYSTGTHLHYRIYVKGSLVDPADYTPSRPKKGDRVTAGGCW